MGDGQTHMMQIHKRRETDSIPHDAARFGLLLEVQPPGIVPMTAGEGEDRLFNWRMWYTVRGGGAFG